MKNIKNSKSWPLGTSLNYPGINTESFLTSLTFFWLLLLLLFFSSLLISIYCQKFSIFFPLLDKSLTGPQMNTESFLSLRTFKKFFVFLSLVKVFFLFLFSGFLFLFHCTLSTASYEYICVYNWEPLHNRDGPGGIQYLCSLSAGVPKMGTIWGRWTKRASGAQCFIMALGLFWDIVTGLPWTPNGVGSLEPKGCCIFLPGAHYLTINSPDGADSSLNKLLQLLLLSKIARKHYLNLTLSLVYLGGNRY